MNIFSEKLILEHEFLLLRPSIAEDLEGLYELAQESVWTHSSTSIHQKEDMEAYISRSIADRQANLRQQLTIWDKTLNIPVGCTSFEHVSEPDQRMEIGWSWLGKAYQGKGYNKISKFLMLSHVFEELNFERVEFRTRGTNIQSQKSLTKIGATREGTLRSYFTDGDKRHDMVYFSLLRQEWLVLKKTVFQRLEQPMP